MPATTRYVGLLLMLIGIASYVLTGRTSITALIPAFFGVIFIVLAYIARNEAARRHAMHVAVALALVGALASLARAIPAAMGGQLTRPAVLAQIVTAVVMGFYVVLGVQSFIAARRARKV
jgi:RsiW-degrading membrane proteinase PrsW (M82 family)